MSKHEKGRKLQLKYEKEASSWDSNIVIEAQKSKKIAWLITSVSILFTFLALIAVSLLTPLKTVEPFVIRVNDTNGMVDVISVLSETDDLIRNSSKELLNKYWLGRYVLAREGYFFDTRQHDRTTVALLSSTAIQQEYSLLQNPKHNIKAPISLYGDTADVIVKIKTISFINSGEIVNNENRVTALIRYTKRVKHAGDNGVLNHWAATVTFVYRNTPMKVEDRLINPLGFQVITYRNDQESYSDGD